MNEAQDITLIGSNWIPLIAIEGKVHRVKEVNNYGYLPLVVLENGEEWYIAPSRERAGEQARAYWRDLVEDPQEAVAILGEETLISWGLGRLAGPGTTKVRSLQEWLDLWLKTPEECWAGYDGLEHACSINRHLRDELVNDGEDWPDSSKIEGVCYRHN